MLRRRKIYTLHVIKMVQTTIYNMDILQGLAKLPDESIDCIVTSPPYYGLRAYPNSESIWDGWLQAAGVECNEHDFSIKHHKRRGGGDPVESTQVGNNKEILHFAYDSNTCWKCGAWKGQLGLEPDYNLYLDHLLQITSELKRVLKSSGSFWFNIGDTYAGSGNGFGGEGDPKNPEARTGQTEPRKSEIPDKSLMMIPVRMALLMVDKQDWILRNDIIWNKPNAMPSSADDRFTNDYEHVFFFVKNKQYYFKQQLEKYTKPMNRWGGEKLKADGTSTWDKGTGQDTYRERDMRPNPEGRNKRAVWSINTEPYSEAHFACYPRELVEQCLKAGCPEGGIVLDPFAGSGTTLQVAKAMGMGSIGIEISPAYCEIIKKRLHAKELLNREEFKMINS